MVRRCLRNHYVIRVTLKNLLSVDLALIRHESGGCKPEKLQSMLVIIKLTSQYPRADRQVQSTPINPEFYNIIAV